ncbi:SDR family oxidoreductase [Chloroflexi bacterium CFX5]|nr:SDR family oxidoreductase [Anaerolineales bacterium]MCQ3953647.1 short-chain dehydrogenase [Chloroflexota bacterium]MDL1920789.1 SDR family oxidoreductase [Chloroflexi bacterium CFX5]
MSPLALVTGSAHRLGKAFALTLARKGYAVALHHRGSVDEAEKTAAEIRALGVDCLPIRADLTVPEKVDFLFSLVDEMNAPLKVVVNSAAIMTAANPRDLQLQDWDSALDLNLRAPFLIAQRAAKRMTAGGLIVNISDIAAQKAWSRYPSYTVSKAGIESLTKILARSLAPTIRVNAIAPGLVLPSEIVTEAQWNQLIEKLPLKRPAAPEEITSALEFLIKNEYITGQTIVVDGGYSLV